MMHVIIGCTTPAQRQGPSLKKSPQPHQATEEKQLCATLQLSLKFTVIDRLQVRALYTSKGVEEYVEALMVATQKTKKANVFRQ